ncbi:ATP-binding cassette domain-containing protein [Desulfobaculum senezii]
MITIHNVCFSYSGAPATLQDISLSIPAGSIVVLAGANGSGKTTLLSLLAGLLSPKSGSIARGPITTPGDEKAFRRSAGLLLQDADLQILGSTVEEDLLLGGAGPQRSAAARDMAQRFDLLQQWQTPVQHLSWGQKRKLCLAATLLREPEFLLLDEPLSGLDYPGMREMRRLIEDSKEAGLTQIITSHDLAPLVDLADIIAVMHGGRLVRAGRPEQVLDGIAEYGVRPPDSWTLDRTLRRWE